MTLILTFSLREKELSSVITKRLDDVAEDSLFEQFAGFSLPLGETDAKRQ